MRVYEGCVYRYVCTCLWDSMFGYVCVSLCLCDVMSTSYVICHSVMRKDMIHMLVSGKLNSIFDM